MLLSILGLTCSGCVTALAQGTFNDQPYQRPENCLPCHQRQFDELRSSVKSGYRNVSPLFNGLEMASNFIAGGLLRPVYADSTVVLPDGVALKTNMFTSPVLNEVREVQAGFCFTCHNAHIMREGDDPTKLREVPQLGGFQNNFRPDLIRPLRDYHLIDAQGNQVLPDTIGGPPPAGALPSRGATGITCDMCHNVSGPDLNRSFQHDGFANTSLIIDHTVEKVGPFSFPVAVKGNFHIASTNPDKIAFLRAGAFCNACHDVRVPLGAPGDLQHEEHNLNLPLNPTGQPVNYFRLENLSTEWQIGGYNSTNNPFGKVVRCQDCHMSQFPFTQNSTYKVGDMTVTTPTPGVFAVDFAAVPGVSTEGDFPLQKRNVVNHFFTGVDVPILRPEELKARLGPSYPDPYESGTDTHGQPKALASRRDSLLRAAVRLNLDHSDSTASLGQELTVRAEAVSLTGHRFPAGFSQERTTYIELTVKDANGFVLYQSGYQVDKPHPETGANAANGNLDDEDLEHVVAVVDPGHVNHPYTTGNMAANGPAGANNGGTNQVFYAGPDDGPDARVYVGAEEGLVLFRNELTRIFLPNQYLGRNDASGNPIRLSNPHYEETFLASFANTVDNFRSLRPLSPRTFRYKIHMPSAAELKELGVQLAGPLQIHAQVNYEHFPPLFLRYLARTTGPNGPSGNDMQLVDEQRVQDLLKSNRAIATADFTVQLQ